ncbi:hypothetical protein SANTM175S_11049 [Streptomyces antimycoticus]
MKESSAKVKPWRDKVSGAITAAILRGDAKPLSGAVYAEITFTMPKPTNAPKRRRTYPAVSPDIDKLERSTYDAISTAKASEDDGRVIESHSRKVYPGEHPDALDQPGAIIRLYALTGALQVTAPTLSNTPRHNARRARPGLAARRRLPGRGRRSVLPRRYQRPRHRPGRGREGRVRPLPRPSPGAWSGPQRRSRTPVCRGGLTEQERRLLRRPSRTRMPYSNGHLRHVQILRHQLGRYLDLAAAGLTDTEIAQVMGVAPSTIRKVREVVKRKTWTVSA